jgi:hypothetical protein
LTSGGSVGVKVNEVESDFFLTGKVLRHGHPLSHDLFTFLVDVFSKMLSRGYDGGLIKGLWPNFISGRVVCLQYVNDTLLFL